VAIENTIRGKWYIQNKVNVRLAISTTTARRRQPSVYLGLRVQMERANPVASKTSRSACPIVVTALTGKRSRIVGLLSQFAFIHPGRILTLVSGFNTFHRLTLASQDGGTVIRYTQSAEDAYAPDLEPRHKAELAAQLRTIKELLEHNVSS
jgi:hypothetical protein